MLSMGNSTISMVIFNSYFDITRGYMKTHGHTKMQNTWADLSARVLVEIVEISVCLKIGYP